MDPQSILKSLENYPSINKYMHHLIMERLSLPNPSSSRLLRIFLDPNNPPDALEKLLCETKSVANFEQIFEVSLGADPLPDEKINDIIAELRGLRHLLYERGFQNVAVVPRGQTKTVDVTATYEGLKFAIEIKHPRGPEFKHHEQIEKTGAYRLDQQRNVINVMRRQVQDALHQIEEFRDNNSVQDYQGIVLVINTRADLSMFYPTTVERAIKDILNRPSAGAGLGAVASVDFIDFNGDLIYYSNPHWTKHEGIDIWPGE
jgi:Holliday junction resolvase